MLPETKMSNASATCVIPDRISGPGLVALTVVGSMFSVVCVVGNFLIFLVYILTRTLHKPCTLLLTNLSFGDLLYGFLGFPMYVITDFLTFLFCNRVFYSVRIFILYLVINMQLNNITLIALERFLGVQIPFFYRTHITIAKTSIVVIVTWLFGIARALFVAMMYRENFKMVVIVEVPLLIVLIIVSFAIYCKVYMVSRQHILNDQRFGIRHQETRSQVAVQVALLNGAAWVPVVFVNALSAGVTDIHYWKQATFLCPFVCTCFNLFIYTYRMREYRDAINKLLHRQATVMPAESKRSNVITTSE